MGPDQLVFLWMILLSLGICMTIFGIRYMRNKENMAMIEKGLDPNLKPEKPRPAPFRNLKWGLLLVGAGLGAGVSSIMWAKADRQATLPKDVRLTFSLVAPMMITPLSNGSANTAALGPAQ